MAVQSEHDTDGVRIAAVDSHTSDPKTRGLVGPTGRALRVLVIGINFGPEHTGIAPYTTQLCEYLVESGAEVDVLTGVPHYPSWTVERAHRWPLRRTVQRGLLRIRHLRHYVPRKQSALRRGLYELTFALNLLLQRLGQRPDVVLAVIPALTSAAVARRVATRAGAPLVLWVQDVMGRAAAQSGISGGSTVAGLVGRLEGAVLRQADEVLLLNQHFEDYAAEAGVSADRRTIRPNWSHVPEPNGTPRDSIRSRYGWKPDETVVLHSGNMGLKQALDNVVEAGRLSASADDLDVRFVLMGDGSQRSHLEHLAEGVPAVQLLDPAASVEYADVLAAADVLLVNERRTSVDMSLPSKLTSYFRSGRPVLAASPEAGGTAAEVRRSGGGLVVKPENPQALIDGVRALASDADAADRFGSRGREYAITCLSADAALSHIAERLVANAADSTRRPSRRTRSTSGGTQA